MTDLDYNRLSNRITCNKCKRVYIPYPDSAAPILDEVSCPICGEKRILYFGDNPDVAKMILSTYDANKELNERLDRVEKQIGALKDVVKTSLDDARNIMTKSLIGVLTEQVNKHVKDYHEFTSKKESINDEQ